VDCGNGHFETVHAQHLILATGSRPIIPEAWQGLENVWTPDEAAEHAILPESVLIVGGGACGCEFATLYSELGIPTILVEQQDRLLAGWDDLASKAVEQSLTRRGVEILLNTKVNRLLPCCNGKIQAILANGDTRETHGVLAALGRQAQLPEGEIDFSGMTRHGALGVDDFCRTALPEIYAVGDVTDRGGFAHTAMRMGRIAADHIAGCAEPMAWMNIPRVVYTHPAIAEVGIGEEACLAEGGRVERFPLRVLGKSHLGLQDSGWMKLMTDSQGRIQGAAAAAPQAEELISEMVLAIHCGLTVSQVAGTISPHPSFSEGWMEAALGSLGLPLHYIPRTNR
jgi:dihydrolipoamide dehydrogenase